MRKFFLKIKLFFISVMTRISIALYSVEENILKADPNDLLDKDKKRERKRHHNQVLEKMLQGQRDEQYIQDYYEILKKADKFLKNSSAMKIATTADKFGMNLGKKDRWGRRYDHFGFFDPKSKYYGKTLAEVLALEAEERKTKDDDYPLELIFGNKPVEHGLAKENQIVEVEENEFVALNEYQKAKQKQFPMMVVRKNKDSVNKIEQLTEYLHVKKINSLHRILEFFIPKKYKVFDLSEKDGIFAEIINIDQVWVKDEYGNFYAYKIDGYRKRIEDHDEMYGIIKLDATQIKDYKNE